MYFHVLDSCLYTGLGRGDAALSSKLFRWHQQVVEHHGLGSIMRAMRPKQAAVGGDIDTD